MAHSVMVFFIGVCSFLGLSSLVGCGKIWGKVGDLVFIAIKSIMLLRKIRAAQAKRSGVVYLDIPGVAQTADSDNIVTVKISKKCLPEKLDWLSKKEYIALLNGTDEYCMVTDGGWDLLPNTIKSSFLWLLRSVFVPVLVAYVTAKATR